MTDCPHPEAYRFTLGATIEGMRCTTCGRTVEQWHRQVDPHPMLASIIFVAAVVAVVAILMLSAAA